MTAIEGTELAGRLGWEAGSVVGRGAKLPTDEASLRHILDALAEMARVRELIPRLGDLIRKGDDIHADEELLLVLADVPPYLDITAVGPVIVRKVTKALGLPTPRWVYHPICSAYEQKYYDGAYAEIRRIVEGRLP